MRADSERQPEPFLFARQRQLLGLLGALGGKVTATDFQKLLFLYSQESGLEPAYEFIPYRFGAFSFTSYSDKQKLIERGLLISHESLWELTAEGKRLAETGLTPRMHRFAEEFGLSKGDALVARTYRDYPYYAIRSQIAERVLAGDATALGKIEAAKPSKSGQGLFTVGYEGRSLESYLNVLIGVGVDLLCDVRRNPISRKYGFSKGTLAKGCDGVGISYVHLPELGIASEHRRSLGSQADYDALFDEYERECIPRQGAALSQIEDWVRSGKRVALTCFERGAHMCHRHCVAEALQRNTAGLIVTQHL